MRLPLRQDPRRAWRRQFIDTPLFAGNAIGSNRTHWALCLARTQACTQIHQPLCIRLDAGVRKEDVCTLPQALLHFFVTGVAFDPLMSRQHALYVAIENRVSRAVCEHADGGCGRPAHTRQLLDRFEFAREYAATSISDNASGVVQVAPPRVVAEPAPISEDLIFARLCKRSQIREALEKARVVGN